MTEFTTNGGARTLRRIGEGDDPAAPPADQTATGRPLRHIGEEGPIPPAHERTELPPLPSPAGEATAGDPVPSDQVGTKAKPKSDPSTTADTGKTRAPTGEGITVRRAWLIVGAILVAAMVAGLIVLGLKVQAQSTTNSLRSSALSTASQDGVLLSSYDYRNLTGPGSAWSKLEASATPSFRKDFLSTSGSLGKLLTQYNATATGKVVSAGVASLTNQRAVVLLFVDQTVNNTVQKSASSTQPLRTEVTLVRGSGKWQLNNLTVPK